MSFTAQVREELIGQRLRLSKRRSFLRQCFLLGGVVTDPSRAYHMEFALGEADAQTLIQVLAGYGLSPKVTSRRGQTLVYVKSAEEIADILNIMKAHKSLLMLENIRVEKDLRNNLNRKVNFEAANLNKTVGAALDQIEAIKYIAVQVGLGYLSEPLEQTARLRLAYETASLEEIGAMLTPPIGKSGVNHRLRRISEIANTIKGSRREND